MSLYGMRQDQTWYNPLMRETGNQDRYSTEASGYEYVLSHPEHVWELLSFLDNNWLGSDESFIEDELKVIKGQQTDFIYSYSLDNGVKRYLLILLQSNVDEQAVSRLFLRNEVWLQSVRNHTVNPVFFLPIILYNGAKTWTSCRSLSQRDITKDLNFTGCPFDLHVSDYVLLDVQRLSKHALLKCGNVVSSVFLLEQSRNRQEFLKQYRWVTDRIQEWEAAHFHRFQYWVWDYLSKGMTARGKQQLYQLMVPIKPQEVNEMFMSNLERVIKRELLMERIDGWNEGMTEGRQAGLKEGLQKGMQEGLQTGMRKGKDEGVQIGIQKGFQQGILQGKIDVARRMHQQGMSIQQIQEATDLTLTDWQE